MSVWLVAASTTAVVWLTIGLVSTVAVVALLIALVRHAMVVGRAVGRFQDEVSPILEDMSRERSSASRLAGGLGGAGEANEPSEAR